MAKLPVLVVRLDFIRIEDEMPGCASIAAGRGIRIHQPATEL